MLRIIGKNPESLSMPFFPVMSLFDEFVKNSVGDEIKNEKQNYCAMPLDLTETEKDYRVIANLPGFTKELVKISLDNNQLTIETVDQEKKEENAVYHHKERFCGKYHRLIYMPENVDVNEIKAKMENGLLELIIPKQEVKPQKLINIE